MRSWYKQTAFNSASMYARDGQYQLWDRLTAAFFDDEELEAFFSSIQLLVNIPTSHLIPDDTLLPAESLRIFYLDDNWLSCFSNGALSIGRNCDKDERHDNALHPNLYKKARLGSAGIRNRRFGKPVPETNAAGIRTGFLLHSEVVRGWPGLEVACFGGGYPLTMLRLDNIGDSILLGIVEGETDEITFTEPEEGLHFGLEEKDGRLVKQLASLQNDEAGKLLEKYEQAAYRDGGLRVLEISELAQSMENTLSTLGKGGDFFSSLEFAVQMLHRRTRVTISFSREASM